MEYQGLHSEYTITDMDGKNLNWKVSGSAPVLIHQNDSLDEEVRYNFTTNSFYVKQNDLLVEVTDKNQIDYLYSLYSYEIERQKEVRLKIWI